MFDIGFSELLVIALVTLLVMGPERLPQTVRSISLWIGRLKQMLASARRDLEQEVGMDDIRQQLHNEQVMRELNESKDHLEESYNKAFDSNLEMTSENPFEANEEPLADEESPASSNKEPSASPNKEPAADKEHKSDD
jgi:sec-independent protein translocase protein TatB